MGEVVNIRHDSAPVTISGQSQPLKSGDGSGTFGGMEQRVAALEAKTDRIETKLDGLVASFADFKSDLKPLIKDVAEIKGHINGMPSAQAFGELKGRVDSLPTTAKISSLLALAVAIAGLAFNWAPILAALKR